MYWSTSTLNKKRLKFLLVICNLSQKSAPHGSFFKFILGLSNEGIKKGQIDVPLLKKGEVFIKW